jgi:hypothetical protein
VKATATMHASAVPTTRGAAARRWARKRGEAALKSALAATESLNSPTQEPRHAVLAWPWR